MWQRPANLRQGFPRDLALRDVRAKALPHFDWPGAQVSGCASILLAAGASERLGRPKQLLLMGGESLLRRSARHAVRAGCGPNIVVLGAYAEDLRQQLDGLAVEIVINQQWPKGMGSSLAVAIDSLLRRSPIPRAVLLLVCDQPNVSAELLRALIEKQAAAGGRIVASRYAGVLGVPAVFPAAFFPELAAVEGDQGARRILSQHFGETGYIDFPLGSWDVDTPADAAMLEQWKQKESE